MIPTSNPSRYLVATDIDAIQSYLLQSYHLSAIAGASQLIDAADTEIELRAKNKGGETIIASGGIGLFEFPDSNSANDFRTEIVPWYRKLSVSGHLSTSDVIEVDPTNPFGGSAQAAFANLERTKRSGFASGEVVSIPQGRMCESCGKEVAQTRIQIGRPPDASERWVGEACQAKHQRRGSDRSFWLDWLQKTDRPEQDFWKSINLRQHVAYDFNQLAGENDLGLIVADADGTGRILKSLTTCEKSIWQDFSEGLKKLSRDALTHTLNAAVSSILPRSKDGTTDGLLPVLPLFCGGDDIVIACRGDLALPLASRLCRKFAEEPKAWCPGHKLGLSAAVVVTRPGFPFRVAHRIASELLRNAKREARHEGWKNDGVGAIDYALITESLADANTIQEDRLIESRCHRLALHLSGRPYRASGTGSRSIEGLEHAVEDLVASGFPRSKLHELREICSRTTWIPTRDEQSLDAVKKHREQIESRLQYWFARISRNPQWQPLLKRLSEDLGCRLQGDQFSPWIPTGQTTDSAKSLQTPLGDLADAARLFGLQTDVEHSHSEKS